MSLQAQFVKKFKEGAIPQFALGHGLTLLKDVPRLPKADAALLRKPFHDAALLPLGAGAGASACLFSVRFSSQAVSIALARAGNNRARRSMK